MFIFLSFVCKCFRFSESEFPTQSSSSNCAYLQYLQLEQESFFFWEIVQPIAMLLRFSRHYFHVTSGGFFLSPFLSNQYHFVEVNTFDAGINAPTSSNQLLIVFWKCIIAPPTLPQPPHPHSTLINFWPISCLFCACIICIPEFTANFIELDRGGSQEPLLLNLTLSVILKE